jgi:hypothetical protein
VIAAIGYGLLAWGLGYALGWQVKSIWRTLSAA